MMGRAPKMRTLQEVTGVRPACEYCHKPLKPATFYVYLPGHWDHAPTLEEVKQEAPDAAGFIGRIGGYAPEAAFSLRHEESHDGKPRTRLKYWTGRYEHYGEDEKGVPLFCTLNCALWFASACHQAGMRMKQIPPEGGE